MFKNILNDHFPIFCGLKNVLMDVMLGLTSWKYFFVQDLNLQIFFKIQTNVFVQIFYVKE